MITEILILFQKFRIEGRMAFTETEVPGFATGTRRRDLPYTSNLKP